MLKVVNPATEETIHELGEDTAKTISQKFQMAEKAQKDWQRRPLKERVQAIQAFRTHLVKKKEALAKTLTTEIGKPIRQSRSEIEGVLTRLDFFVEQVGEVIQGENVYDNNKEKLLERITQEPLGVIANISAWNYPYYVGSNVFLPALLTGNSVLYKPSEFSSLTGLAIEEMIRASGIAPGVFSLVVGTGKVGSQLLQQAVAGIFFTGSYATGAQIAQTAAKRMIKVQLELGGKDPAYVCEDVSISQAAASLADGAFYNTGQSCCSVERIYVHKKIYPAFVDAFLSMVKSFVLGDPLDEHTYIGPVTRKDHLAYLQKQVADAKKKGAKLIAGGKRVVRPGFFFEPTVFMDADHSMLLMREETFGPLIGIQPVKDDAQALQLMNDTEYGLTAAVYTPDKKRAEKILAEVRAGSVYWNCCDRVSPRLPWSGRGHSGIGSTLSHYGISTFLQPKAWHFKG